MSTLRIARRPQHLRMDSRAVNDGALSFRARGVLAWLLDKPDDWTINAEAISRHGTEGRDAIRKALSELEAAGYLVRRRYRAEGGKWASEQVLYEHPSMAQPERETSAGEQQRLTSAGGSGDLLNPPTEVSPKPVTQGPSALPSGPAGDDARDVTKRAKVVLDAVWETRRARSEPVPASYVGARKVIEALLRAGHADDAVREACLAVPTISTGWLEGELAKRRPKANGRAPSTDRDAPAGRLAL